MSEDRNPLTQRYLDQLGVALDRAAVGEHERRAILGEIESHLAESSSSGVPLIEALERLGPAADLAHAYAVELALNPRPVAPSSSLQSLRTAITRASATLASMLLVVVMGSLGLGFVLAGVFGLLAGLVAPFLPAHWIDPTLRPGLPQVVVVLLGAALLSVGIVSIRIVHLNARVLLRALRRDSREVST